MSDLIDRQAAIEAVLHHGEIENNYTDLYHDGYCDGVYDSADMLKDLPSAEPEHATCYLDSPCEYQNPQIKIPMPTAERKEAHWKPRKHYVSPLHELFVEDYECSNCHFQLGELEWNYCPICGSRMEDQSCRE